MFCDSVRRLYENVRFVVLTTPTSRMPEASDSVQVFSRPIGDGPLLYERMKHYADFLDEGEDDRAYLFLETDMLMLHRFAVDVSEDWDVAIAYKDKGMWINSGMFLVRAGRRAPAIAFLRRALTFYEERHLTHPKWGADQAALRDAIGLTEPPNRLRVEVTDTAKVLLIPRAGFTPFARRFAALSPPDVWILHFSQYRKKWMKGFYWLHLGAGAPVGRLLSRLSVRRSVSRP